VDKKDFTMKLEPGDILYSEDGKRCIKIDKVDEQRAYSEALNMGIDSFFIALHRNPKKDHVYYDGVKFVKETPELKRQYESHMLKQKIECTMLRKFWHSKDQLSNEQLNSILEILEG
jgi:hypothetical protein